MTMKESYLDAIEWLTQHPRNGIIVSVKTDKQLKEYKKYFRVQIDSDLFLDDSVYDRVEWKIEPSLDK